MPVVPRPSVADKHPYILTGHDTFSAPGAFAHDLQALRCASVAGEVEEGSRNEALPVEPTFHCSIPFKTLAFLTTPEGVLKIAEPLAESAQLPNGRGRSDFSEPGQNPFRRQRFEHLSRGWKDRIRDPAGLWRGHSVPLPCSSCGENGAKHLKNVRTTGFSFLFCILLSPTFPPD